MLKTIIFSGVALLGFSIGGTATASPCTIDLAETACSIAPETAPRSRPGSRLSQPVTGGLTIEIGATIPRGEYSILLNAEYYGLDPVSNGWVYMDIENEVYRVDFSSHEVLEKVTHLTAANW